MSPSLLYHKPLRNCNVFCKSKKKTNLLCLLTTSFNIARFGHENEVRRKALKPGKKWNPALFGIWNPLCWNPESSTRNPESTSWNPESKTVLDSLTWGDQSLSTTTVLFRTTFTWTIKLNLLLKLSCRYLILLNSITLKSNLN